MQLVLIVSLLIAFSLTQAVPSWYDESEEEGSHLHGDHNSRGKRVFLENKRVFLENKREPAKRVFLENKRDDEKRVFLENKREPEKRVFLENKRVFLENKRDDWDEENHQHLQPFSKHRLGQEQLTSSEEEAVDDSRHSFHKRVFLENKRNPEKRVFLENKRVFLENKRDAEKRVFEPYDAEKRVFLENKRDAEKRVFLENKRDAEKRVFLENKRVFLENKRDAEKRVFLENKRSGSRHTHHQLFEEQPTHLRGFKDEHTTIQHDVSEELRS